MTALIDDPALGFTGPTRASIPRWPSSSTQDALQAQLKVPVKLSPRCPSSLAQGARQAQFKVYESSAIEFEPFGRPNTAAIRAASEGLSCIEAPAIRPLTMEGGRRVTNSTMTASIRPINRGDPPQPPSSDNEMEVRLTKLETRIETILPTLATKGDVSEAKADIISGSPGRLWRLLR
jgi:hypothetical protein